MKKNKKLFILTTIVCLMPIILSLIMYKDLPDRVAIHFDANGNANNYAPKVFAAFGLPLFMTIVNAIVLFILNNDPKKQNQSEALKLVGIWTIPVLSAVLTPITLFKSMGVNLSINLIIPPLIGIMFIICGNYLPKCKQNYTIGIKLPWTLNNEDNWNRTHHLAGYIWIIGGLINTFAAFILNGKMTYVVMMISLAIMVLVPTIYSYKLYKQGKQC